MRRGFMPGKRKATSGPKQRRVAVIVESSLAGGRAILRGFAQYVRQVNDWAELKVLPVYSRTGMTPSDFREENAIRNV